MPQHGSNIARASPTLALPLPHLCPLALYDANMMPQLASHGPMSHDPCPNPHLKHQALAPACPRLALTHPYMLNTYSKYVFTLNTLCIWPSSKYVFSVSVLYFVYLLQMR